MGGASKDNWKTPTFPPLVTQWTVKSEPKWPGAEYTRRTRLKTVCEGAYSSAFMDELKAILGEDNFEHYEAAMKPCIGPRGRGDPPPAFMPAAKCKIPEAYKLRRAEASTQDLGATTGSMGQLALGELGSTTRSLMGTLSKSRVLDVAHTQWGPTPSYMFEDREQMSSLDEWFDAYGRPTNDTVRRPDLYTQYQPLNRRCCGNPSVQQKMKKGRVTR